MKANLYVREASFIAEEMDKRTEYKVTLQIPASSLNANKKVRHLSLFRHIQYVICQDMAVQTNISSCSKGDIYSKQDIEILFLLI